MGIVSIERKKKVAGYVKNYYKTPKGKRHLRKYRSTEKFKIWQKQANSRYYKTKEGKMYRDKDRLERYWKWKIMLFNILGGMKCCICGFSDIRALQLDHIKGRNRCDNRNVTTFKKYVKDPELARKTLQVLCANCNWIKRYTNSEVSHSVVCKDKLSELANKSIKISLKA